MAAERAAELSDKDVRVVPSRSMQAGLSAAVALDPARSCEDNAAAMERGAHPRAHGLRDRRGARRRRRGRRASASATPSASSTRSWSPGATSRRRSRPCSPSSSREAELVTLIEGDGAPLAGDQVAGLAPDGVELEYSLGGQPAYWWLIAAE